MVGPSLPVDQLTEILVRRNQNGLVGATERKDLVIREAWLHLGDIPNRVPVGSQAGRDSAYHSLVAKESHATSVGEG